MSSGAHRGTRPARIRTRPPALCRRRAGCRSRPLWPVHHSARSRSRGGPRRGGRQQPGLSGRGHRRWASCTEARDAGNERSAWSWAWAAPQRAGACLGVLVAKAPTYYVSVTFALQVGGETNWNRRFRTGQIPPAARFWGGLRRFSTGRLEAWRAASPQPPRWWRPSPAVRDFVRHGASLATRPRPASRSGGRSDLHAERNRTPFRLRAGDLWSWHAFLTRSLPRSAFHRALRIAHVAITA
jgi:hypothetical protein